MNNVRESSPVARYILVLSLLLFLNSSCAYKTKVEKEIRLTFNKQESEFTKARASTGGISLIDIDNDLDLDVFLSNGYDVSGETEGPQQNRLYLNEGNGNLILQEEHILSNDTLFSSGSVWGDYNNDGLVDVFIANQRSQDNALYRNTGDGAFERIINLPITQSKGHSYSANWSDIDNDGDLDLYVANGGISHQEADFLYTNNGDGTFSKAPQNLITADEFSTIGGLWRDFNGDKLPDLYASYRLQKDRIYINKGNWEFEIQELDVPIAERYSFPKSAGTVGDYDNDGDLDIYQTVLMGGANFFFENNGKGEFLFVDHGTLTSLGAHTYGAAFSDFDNNGFLDIVEGNWGSSAHLFSNNGKGFTAQAKGPLSERIFYASTIVTGDINEDGKADVIIPQWPNSRGVYEQNEVFINATKDSGNWVKLKLKGSKSNRSAIGAKVKVKCQSGGEEFHFYRTVSSQQGWRSQSGLIQHMGLGGCEEIAELTISWPSSLTPQQVVNLKVNTMYVIEEKAKESANYPGF